MRTDRRQLLGRVWVKGQAQLARTLCHQIPQASGIVAHPPVALKSLLSQPRSQPDVAFEDSGIISVASLPHCFVSPSSLSFRIFPQVCRLRLHAT